MRDTHSQRQGGYYGQGNKDGDKERAASRRPGGRNLGRWKVPDEVVEVAARLGCEGLL